MALGLQRPDELEGVQAHRARRSAVIAQIALTVAFDSPRANGSGVARQLGHAAIRYVDRMQNAAHCARESRTRRSICRIAACAARAPNAALRVLDAQSTIS